MVNTIIAGTQKGGTTALADMLRLHPQVFVPEEKEVHFYDYESRYWKGGKPNYDAYEAAFEGGRDRAVRIDATPIYMYWPAAIERIAEYNPHSKIIVLLRDPVSRAFSQYRMEFTRGSEHMDFTSALLRERRRLHKPQDMDDPLCSRRCHSYVDRGRYSLQISRLRRNFPSSHVLVLSSAELAHSHCTAVSRILEFLEIEPVDLPERRVHVGPPGRMTSFQQAWLKVLLAKERAFMRSLGLRL